MRRTEMPSRLLTTTEAELAGDRGVPPSLTVIWTRKSLFWFGILRFLVIGSGG